MIVLDTNVISESLRPVPTPVVLAWLGAQDRRQVYLTTITEAETLYGLERLPRGKRREKLHIAVEEIVARFDGRILPFDEPAARIFANLMAGRDAMGRPMSLPDAMIAAIARAHDASLATRNVRDFEHCGIALIDPWKS